MAFTVDVAKKTLHNMGYSGVGEGPEDNGVMPEETPITSPTIAPMVRTSSRTRPADPLWEFEVDEMIRRGVLTDDSSLAAYTLFLLGSDT